MTAALDADGLGKRYGRQWALSRLHAADPGGPGRRPGRAERRRQDHAAEPGRRAAARRRRAPSRCSAASRRQRPASWAGSASWPRTRRPTPAVSRRPSPAGRRLNPHWDGEAGRRRIEPARPRPDQRAGKLSGGQRAQLALTLAIAKRPELLILDEPVASLDPLARREFLQLLMEAVAEQEVSVVLSSHLVADLERVCDYLVVLWPPAGPGGRRVGRPAGHAPPAHRVPPRSGHACPRNTRSSRRATPTRRPRCWSAPTRRSSTRPGRSRS